MHDANSKIPLSPHVVDTAVNKNWDPIVIDSELDTDCDYTGGVNYCLKSDKGSNEGYSDDWTDSDNESLIKFDNEDYDLLVAEVEGLAVLLPYDQLLERKLLNNGSKLNRIEHCGIPEGL
jgi:hypothetical protein